VHVTMVDKNKAVVCCLLATSAIILSEKKKASVKCGVRSVIWKGMYHAVLICSMNYWEWMVKMIALWWCHRDVGR